MRKVCKVYVQHSHIHIQAELTVFFCSILSCYFVGNHQTQSCVAPSLTLLNFWFRYTFLCVRWTTPRPFIPRSWSFSNKTHFRHHFRMLSFFSHPCAVQSMNKFCLSLTLQSIFHLRERERKKKQIGSHFKKFSHR